MSLALTVSTLEELRDYICQTLCSRDQIDPRQTSVIESVITRSGRWCGMFFRMRGPRSHLAHAIWAAEENRVLFYDSRGMRIEQAHLTVPVTLPADITGAN